ncbi:MAG: hypothetical protein WCT77_08100 [Bacteroidota bacterium]
MAKAQTFGDKLKKKKGDARIHAKVIQGFRTPEGTMRFTERFVSVADINELEKIEVN